jgi:hypothetical protein
MEEKFHPRNIQVMWHVIDYPILLFAISQVNRPGIYKMRNDFSWNPSQQFVRKGFLGTKRNLARRSAEVPKTDISADRKKSALSGRMCECNLKDILVCASSLHRLLA